MRYDEYLKKNKQFSRSIKDIVVDKNTSYNVKHGVRLIT